MAGNAFRREVQPRRAWLAGGLAGIAGLVAIGRADVIGEHPGTAEQKTIYRAWAAEPRPLFLAYPDQPSIYSRSVRSCGKADCPNPFTARTIQADFQFTRPGEMVSAHSYLVLGSPAEIERASAAIVAYARSAQSPLVTTPP